MMSRRGSLLPVRPATLMALLALVASASSLPLGDINPLAAAATLTSAIASNNNVAQIAADAVAGQAVLANGAQTVVAADGNAPAASSVVAKPAEAAAAASAASAPAAAATATTTGAETMTPAQRVQAYFEPVCGHLEKLQPKQMFKIQSQMKQFVEKTAGKMSLCFMQTYSMDPNLTPVNAQQLQAICGSRNLEPAAKGSFGSFLDCASQHYDPALDAELAKINKARANCAANHNHANNDPLANLSHDDDELSLISEVVNKVMTDSQGPPAVAAANVEVMDMGSRSGLSDMLKSAEKPKESDGSSKSSSGGDSKSSKSSSSSPSTTHAPAPSGGDSKHGESKSSKSADSKSGSGEASKSSSSNGDSKSGDSKSNGNSKSSDSKSSGDSKSSDSKSSDSKSSASKPSGGDLKGSGESKSQSSPASGGSLNKKLMNDPNTMVVFVDDSVGSASTKAPSRAGGSGESPHPTMLAKLVPIGSTQAPASKSATGGGGGGPSTTGAPRSEGKQASTSKPDSKLGLATSPPSTKAPNGNSKSGDSKSGDSKSGDSKSSDSKSGDSKSGDSKSSDSKSGDSKSGDSKSSGGGGDSKGSGESKSQSSSGDSGARIERITEVATARPAESSGGAPKSASSPASTGAPKSSATEAPKSESSKSSSPSTGAPKSETPSGAPKSAAASGSTGKPDQESAGSSKKSEGSSKVELMLVASSTMKPLQVVDKKDGSSSSGDDSDSRKAIKALQEQRSSGHGSPADMRMHQIEHERQMSIDPVGHTIKHQEYDKKKAALAAARSALSTKKPQ